MSTIIPSSSSNRIVPEPPAQSDAGMITVDMSGATESNTGQKGGNTSLGQSSRIEIAAVHGRPDSGLDSYTATVELTDKPADAIGIRVSMTCSTPDAAAAIGSNAGLYLYFGSTATPTQNAAYLAGWQWQNVNTRYRTHEGVSRMGTVPGGVTIIDTQANVGELYAVMDIYLDETDLPTRAASRIWGEGGVTNGLNTGSGSSNLTSATNFYVGFCCDQEGVSPGDSLDMSDVVIKYCWTTKPTI